MIPQKKQPQSSSLSSQRDSREDSNTHPAKDQPKKKSTTDRKCTSPKKRRRDLTAEDAEWAEKSEELAVFVDENMVNRRDCYGAYGPNNPTTVKKTLTTPILVRHFKSHQTIGIHTLSQDELTKFVCCDSDNHESDPDVARKNKEWVLDTQELLFDADIESTIEDSDGQGGYHLWVLCKEGMPGELAVELGQLLTKGIDCEVFPKSAKLTGKGCGNWIRVFARHHTRPHFSRVLQDGRLLSGSDAVDCFLNATLNPLSAIEDFVRSQRSKQLQKYEQLLPDQIQFSKKRKQQLKKSGVDSKLLSALEHVDWNDYNEWIKVGMALKQLDVSLLPLWVKFASSGKDFDEQECHRKWGSFSDTGKLSLGTIYHSAKKNGWSHSQTSEHRTKPHYMASR